MREVNEMDSMCGVPDNELTDQFEAAIRIDV